MATEPHTAFFSYSRDDSEFALRLAEDLKAADANVWLDQLDIAPGQRWARAVQDALNNCQRLLVILSPSSVSSTNVEDEVAFALEEHKTVIPVFYRDCKVPFQLRPFQYVDFRTDYDRGLKTLLRTLGAVEQQAVAAGGAAASAMPKDTAADVSDADESERAAEQQRLEQEEEYPWQEARKRVLIGIAVGFVVLLFVGILWWRRSHNQTSQPQTAAQQVQTQPQSMGQQPQATESQRQSVEQQPLSTEPKPQPQTAVQQPQPQPQTAVQQRKGAGPPQPPPPAADAKRPVAKNCPEGAYCDPDTNLMWTIEDNGKDITWPDAEQYCKNRTLAGLSGWELPPIDELKKLYGPTNTSGYKVRKPFRLTACCEWSSTKEG